MFCFYFYFYFNTSEPFQCTQCYVSFGNQHHLNIHFSNKHRRPYEPRNHDKAYQCQACPRSYAIVQSLLRHCKVNHGLSAQEAKRMLQ